MNRTEFLEKYKQELYNVNLSFDYTEEQFKLFLKFTEFINENIPQKLYRYRKCDSDAKTIEAFEANKLYYSTPTGFNDPHDSLLGFDIEKVELEIEKKLGFQSLFSACDLIKNGDYSPLSNPGLTEENRADIISNAKLLSLDDIRSLADQLSFKKNRDVVYDIIENYIKETLKKKMISFSEDIYSTLMWAHYTDSHRGFALEFDFRNKCYDINIDLNSKSQQVENRQFITLFPIIYDKHRYDAAALLYDEITNVIQKKVNKDFPVSIQDILAATKGVLHKSLDWEYEKEWRLMPVSRNIENYDSFQFAPTGIYYGINIDPDHKKRLREIAKSKGISEYQMKLNRYSLEYKLDVIPLS